MFLSISKEGSHAGSGHQFWSGNQGRTRGVFCHYKMLLLISDSESLNLSQKAIILVILCYEGTTQEELLFVESKSLVVDH